MVAQLTMGVGDIRVLDKKPNVGRYERGLDGREIRPDDLRARILVAHLDGPEACPGAEVEDFGGRVGSGEWGEVELPVHHLFDELVLLIEPVDFRPIIGVDIG